ncbi:DNase protein [Salix suchowensis]|nr:DNase protein [Salix suchowensis]
MSEILNEVRALLLPADDAQVVLDVLVADEEKPSNPGSSDQPHLLALVSHISSGSSQAGGHEEGRRATLDLSATAKPVSNQPRTVSQMPMDLRVLNKPLHEQLSPASAGLSGDDAADMSLIRDHWPDRDPDIFVFGFQELDLSTEALLYSTSTIKEDSWAAAIFASLGNKASQYTKGNKGGTAVRFAFTPSAQDDGSSRDFRPTILTFVNTHLAAFDEMVDKRNMDFHDLSKRLGFSSYAPVDAVNLPQTSIYESDVLIWMGGKGINTLGVRLLSIPMSVDLNYRIDLPDGEVRSYRYGSGMTDELGYDLKSVEMFNGFVLTSNLISYRRRPAWTDRILHLASPSVRVKQLNYQVHPTVTLSDHRPVSAEFIVPVSHSPIRCHAAGDSSRLRQMKPSVSTHCLRLPKLFLTSLMYGYAPAQGLLLPSEVASITLEINIETKEAATLNLRPNVLGAALILHTALERIITYLLEQSIVSVLIPDILQPINSSLEYSCFANDLNRLTHLPGPVRSLRSQDELLPENRGVNAPREIMRLVNWLMESGDIVRIFRVADTL